MNMFSFYEFIDGSNDHNTRKIGWYLYQISSFIGYTLIYGDQGWSDAISNWTYDLPYDRHVNFIWYAILFLSITN